MAQTQGWGSGGWAAPINVQNTTKQYLSELHPLVQQASHALEGAYPGYINNTLSAYHNFATPSGQWNQVGNERGAYGAAASDQGRASAFQTGLQGGGETAQNAARMQAQQQGFAAGNQYQARMGSPEGQQAANQYGNQLLGNLVNGPANQAYQQNLQDFNQRMQINNTAPQQQGFLGSLVGAAAPFLGMIPGVGGHAASALGGAVGGQAGAQAGGALPNPYGYNPFDSGDGYQTASGGSSPFDSGNGYYQGWR